MQNLSRKQFEEKEEERCRISKRNKPFEDASRLRVKCTIDIINK
jgi:hypothetical protein